MLFMVVSVAQLIEWCLQSNDYGVVVIFYKTHIDALVLF